MAQLWLAWGLLEQGHPEDFSSCGAPHLPSLTPLLGGQYRQRYNPSCQSETSVGSWGNLTTTATRQHRSIPKSKLFSSFFSISPLFFLWNTGNFQRKQPVFLEVGVWLKMKYFLSKSRFSEEYLTRPSSNFLLRKACTGLWSLSSYPWTRTHRQNLWLGGSYLSHCFLALVLSAERKREMEREIVLKEGRIHRNNK